MKKLINPYTQISGYYCFGCSPDNKHGLQMEFKDEGEFVICEWNPKPHFQGYREVLHGGIQATLMDEIASWCVQVKAKTAGVTSKLNIRYKSPAYTSQGKILIKARLIEKRRNLADVEVFLYNSENNLCAEGLITYFLFPLKFAKEKLYFPSDENFYKE